MNDIRKLIEALNDIEEAGLGKPGPKTFQQRGLRGLSRDEWKELLRLANVVIDQTIEKARLDDDDDTYDISINKYDRHDITFRFMEAWDKYLREKNSED